jgi:CRISPR-associated exonuclease Cas4
VLKIPQNEEKYYKVMKGRNIHNLKLVQNKDYLRKKIGVKEKYLDQYLTNCLIRGKIDEVLLLNDNTMAPLDYKFAKYNNKIFQTYKIQLFCYAWLIKNNFNCDVKKGFLVYTRSQNKLIEINVTDKDISHVKQSAEKIFQIIDKNYYPKATKYKKRCVSCTYKNICVK